MTKQKLVEVMSAETKLSKKQIENLLTVFAETVEKTVAKGEKVNITGFGTFDLGTRAGRRGINPQTKQPINIPEMRIPRFRAGKRFKQVVR